MPVSRVLRPVVRPRAAALAAMCAALAIGCSPDDGSTKAQPTDVTGASTSDLAAAVGTIAEIPEVAPERLAPVAGAWEGARGDGPVLVAYRETDRGTRVLGRFDPDDGSLVAARELPSWGSFTVVPEGVLLLRTTERRLDVLDPEDLSDRWSIPLPDGRPDLNTDTPREGPLWLGLRRTGEDQLAGRPTAMAIARIDLERGVVAEVRDVTACGAKSAAQLDPRRVAFNVECAYQPAILDLVTGEETAFDGFPDGAHVHGVDGTAWFRWKTLGYIARLGDDGLETLDLNAGGPVLANLHAFLESDRDIFITGEPADGSDPVMFRIDPDEFRVTARARVPSHNTVFIDGWGYQAGEGGLIRFRASDVDGPAPTGVVRPDPGVPPAAVAETGDEQAVIDAATLVFDPATPAVAAAAHLEDPEVGVLRDRVVAVGQSAYPGVTPRVTAVAVDDATAAINYVLLRDGRTAFVPLSATLRWVDGRWVVTRDSICDLMQIAAIPGC